MTELQEGIVSDQELEAREVAFRELARTRRQFPVNARPGFCPPAGAWRELALAYDLLCLHRTAEARDQVARAKARVESWYGPHAALGPSR